MKSVKVDLGRCFVFLPEYDSDLLGSVVEAAKEHGIDAAFFMALGALRSASIRYYEQDRKEYRSISLNEPLEIISCVGNIGRLKGEIFAHAHAVLADKNGRAYGGHLADGCRVFACEIMLFELKGVSLNREYDETTGLNLFSLR